MWRCWPPLPSLRAALPTLSSRRAAVLAAGPDYYGPATLEERIAGADAIIRARVALGYRRSGATRGDRQATSLPWTTNSKWWEYLSGSGASEIVGVVYDASRKHKTASGAVSAAEALKDSRETQWDDREAIVFLIADHPGLPSSYRTDRYRLGSHYSGTDHYTISSRTQKRWLPAAATSGVSSVGGESGSLGQSYLLDAPQPASGGASGISSQSGSPPTITLTDMKAKISALNVEVAAGGGTQAYRDCLYLKHRWEREVLYPEREAGRQLLLHSLR